VVASGLVCYLSLQGAISSKFVNFACQDPFIRLQSTPFSSRVFAIAEGQVHSIRFRVSWAILESSAALSKIFGIRKERNELRFKSEDEVSCLISDAPQVIILTWAHLLPLKMFSSEIVRHLIPYALPLRLIMTIDLTDTPKNANPKSVAFVSRGSRTF
jgi:hypothetical protein